MGIDIKMIPKNILVDLKKEGIDPGSDNNLSANEIVTGWKNSRNQGRAENVIRTYFAFLYNKDENAAENLRLEIRNLSDYLNNSLKALHAELALIGGEKLLINKGVKITIDSGVSMYWIYNADLRFELLPTGGIKLTGYKSKPLQFSNPLKTLHIFNKVELSHLKEIRIELTEKGYAASLMAIYDDREPEEIIKATNL